MSTNRGNFFTTILSHPITICNNIINAWAYTVIGGDIMGLFNCNCKASCTGLGVLASLAVGVVTLILTITGRIAISALFAQVGFVVAFVFLLLTFLVALYLSDCNIKKDCCVCRGLSALHLGVFGTVISSLVLLGIEFAATSFVGAFVYGVFAFFFVLIVTSAICLTRCLACCDD